MSDRILTDPWGVIRDLYKACDPGSIDQFPTIVTEHFKAHLQSSDAFNAVPVLDLQCPPESFQDGSIVVFHAMIQDTSISPELYLARCANGEWGGWALPAGDADETDDVQFSDLRECSVFWAVSIPGLSAWCIEGRNYSGNASSHRSTRPHKFPIPAAPHIGVQLKIYDESLAHSLRTNLSLHSSIEQDIHPNVPTLHVLFQMAIPISIVPRSFPDTDLLPTIKSVREELIQWIADEGLAGDRLAAEWVLLCAIARVRSRSPPILPLSLTLAGFPPPLQNPKSTPTLHHVLSNLFPLITTVPLSLNNFNNTPSSPESKGEDLHSGWLQHPKGSILLLTENAFSEGGICNKGLMNMRSIQEMMKTQTLDYVFPFSGFRFDTDCNFLVVTEGKSSIFFRTDVNVSLRASVPVDQAKNDLYRAAEAISLPPPDKLTLFRRLVGGSKIGQLTIGEATGKHIEEDFVQERSTKIDKGPGFTSDDLVQRMLVARLVALSLHEAELTAANWDHAKELENWTKYR